MRTNASTNADNRTAAVCGFSKLELRAERTLLDALWPDELEGHRASLPLTRVRTARRRELPSNQQASRGPLPSSVA
jgi:hypothetical protein